MGNIYLTQLFHKHLAEIHWKTPLIKCRSIMTLRYNGTIEPMKSLSWESMKLLFLNENLLSISRKPDIVGLYKQRR